MAKGRPQGSPDYVGYTSIFFAVLMLWRNLFRATEKVIQTRRAFLSDPQGLMLVPVLLAMWGLVILMSARLLGIFLCPSSEWGVEGGCVPTCEAGIAGRCVPP
mmetsp:Transcript_3673/g.7328  ORF Transcript_3673/g.7328 Transcript_3673/m.7328 type:complete len:103 (+) Transcript_3673:41-349(+)